MCFYVGVDIVLTIVVSLAICCEDADENHGEGHGEDHGEDPGNIILLSLDCDDENHGEDADDGLFCIAINNTMRNEYKASLALHV